MPKLSERRAVTDTPPEHSFLPSPFSPGCPAKLYLPASLAVRQGHGTKLATLECGHDAKRVTSRPGPPSLPAVLHGGSAPRGGMGHQAEEAYRECFHGAQD